MKLESARPFVRQAVRGTLESSRERDIHCTFRTVDSRMFYIISGRGQLCAAGKNYSLSPGCAVIFKAGTPYEWDVTDMQLFIINFDYSDKYSDITRTFHPIHSENFDDSMILDCGKTEDEQLLYEPIVVGGAVSLEPLFRMMVTEYSIGGRYAGELLSEGAKTIIYAILRFAVEKLRTAGEKETPLVRSIIEYIDENLGGDISNRRIADEYHFNASYLNRVFKKYTGMTLHEYILQRRIDSAAEKLSSENLPIADIAKITGFSGAAHFTKTFRKRMGISPTEYRNM